MPQQKYDPRFIPDQASPEESSYHPNFTPDFVPDEKANPFIKDARGNIVLDPKKEIQAAHDTSILKYKGGDIGGKFDEFRNWATNKASKLQLPETQDSNDPDLAFSKIVAPSSASLASLTSEPARFVAEVANDPLMLASGAFGVGRRVINAGMNFGDAARLPRIRDLGNVAPTNQRLLNSPVLEGEVVNTESHLPVRQPREVPYTSPESYSTVNGDTQNVTNAFDELMHNKNPPATEIPEIPIKSSESKALQIIPDEPSFSRTAEGKLKMDIRDPKPIIRILKKFYEGNPSTIATKELLQNSMDEIAVAHPDGSGTIGIYFNDKDNTLIIGDDGRGMTRKQIETVYTNLGDTGKSALETIGGFGIAKAVIQLGGDRVAVETIARNPETGLLEKTTYDTTPDELMSGETSYETIEVPEETPTGTKVKITYSKDNSFYLAKNFVNNLTQYSNGKGKINHNASDSYDEKIITSHQLTPTKNAKLIGNIDTPSANYTVSIPHDAKTTSLNKINLILTNKGMFQGIMEHNLDFEAKIPDKLIIDVSSKVDALHDDYAFTPSRERLRYNAKDSINKLINEEIVNPQLKHRKSELIEVYEGMGSFNVGSDTKGITNSFERKISYYDVQDKFTKDEIEQITSNQVFKDLSRHIVETIDDILSRLNKERWTSRLEKSGILFDSPTVFGVTIPHPETKKAAILINPLASMTKYSDPDKVISDILSTIEHELAHLELDFHGSPHGDSWRERYHHIQAEHGATAQNIAKEKLRAIITGEGEGYNTDIQEILQKYNESRGREKTTPDILTGTGYHSEGSSNISGGKKGRDKNVRPSGKGTTPVQSALKKLADSVIGSKGLREEQEKIYSRERAKRFAAFEGVKEGGASGAAKSLSKLKGEMPKLNIESLQLTDVERDSLFTAVKDANISNGEKAKGYKALFKLLSGGHVPQRNELHILDIVFGKGMGMQGGPGAASEYDILSDILGEAIGEGSPKEFKTPSKARRVYEITRGLMSVDIPYMTSAAFRQGVGLAGTRRWFQAVGEQAKVFGNEEVYDKLMSDLEKSFIHVSRMNYNPERVRTEITTVADQIGLKSSDLKSLSRREEQIRSTLTEKIPFIGIGPYIRASNRSYTIFLNSLRTHTAEDWLDASGLIDKNGNITNMADARRIGTTINELTGAASLNVSMPFSRFTESAKELNLDKSADVLSLLFFSPKLLIRDARMMNPLNYIKNDKLIRLEYLKGAIRRASVWAGFTGLSAVGLGAVVSNEITSSDFGKAKVGNTRSDSGSGLLQWMVLMSREALGESTSSTSNKSTKLGSSAVAPTRMSLLENFLINRLHPTLGLGALALTASKNRPFYPISATLEHVLPMYTSDIIDVMNSDPKARQIILSLAASSLSMGSQTYGKEDFGKPQFNVPGDVKFEGAGLLDTPSPKSRPRSMRLSP